MGPRTDGVAVLLMAYGAASSPENVPAYLQDIRGGRPASPELVADIRERYRLLGGKSPLLDITRRQAAALQKMLGHKVYVGMRHSPPWIAEAVRAMKQDGAATVVTLPLTPYFSSMSTGAYRKKYDEACREAAASWRTVHVGSWRDEPLLIEALASKLSEALGRFPEAERVAVLFTAHSLPERILKEGDPYPGDLAETIRLVAGKAGLARWEFAYQSRGRTPEPWLGPDAGAVIERLAASGVKNLLLAPLGFISDHMETLYDDDILYRRQAESLGLRFERAASLNDDPAFIRALAAVVKRCLE